MALMIGVDSGTQSVKAAVYDADKRVVTGEGRAPHAMVEGLPGGHMEQRPETWTEAMDAAIEEALSSADRGAVRAIGVSGQQHGFVPLDGEGRPIRPAKLWCDTSTVEECALIAEALGGEDQAVAKLGNSVLPGFTAPKILWLKRREPENYARLRHILLPHDYLNYYLTGQYFMEYGDASGTALMNTAKREWSREAIEAIDPAIADFLPPLSPSDRPCGRLRPERARQYGVPESVLVSAGGGDNMMGAIGTGNVVPGAATASFGTSGTIYAYSDEPIVDPRGEIAAFCDSSGGFLPLLCTMNVTGVSESIRKLFNLGYEELDALIAKAPVGAGGLVMLPYFDGERTPSIPLGTGALVGLSGRSLEPSLLARAAVEGVTLGMNYGLRRLRELGVESGEARLTGGGSRSPAWRRVIADVFGMPVVCMKEDEGAALGAALQAAWCLARQGDPEASIADIVEGAVEIDESTRIEPDARAHERYRELQAFHDAFSEAMRPVFERHAPFRE